MLDPRSGVALFDEYGYGHGNCQVGWIWSIPDRAKLAQVSMTQSEHLHVASTLPRFRRQRKPGCSSFGSKPRLVLTKWSIPDQMTTEFGEETPKWKQPSSMNHTFLTRLRRAQIYTQETMVS